MSEHSANHSRSSDFIDPLFYWNSIKARLPWIILFTVLVSAGAYYGLKQLEDIYRASTTVLIESSPSDVVNIDDISRSQNPNKEYFLTQFEILKSRTIVERVVDKLNLTEKPSLQPSSSSRPEIPFLTKDEPPKVYTEEELRRVVIDKVMKSRTISPVSNTQLVRIQFESPDPVLARDVSNAIAREFISSRAEKLQNSSRQTNTWLVDRLDDLRTQLRESQEALQQFRDENEFVDMKGQSTIESDHVERLSSDYVAAKSRRILAENDYGQITHFDDNSLPENLLNVPVIKNDPSIQRTRQELDQAIRSIDELSQRYGHKHPKMTEAQSHLQSVRALLQEQIQNVKETLKSRLRSARSAEKDLLRELNSAKQNLQSVNRKEIRLSELEREVQSNREIYDRFLNQAKVTGQVDELSLESARIIDSAFVPSQPAKPKRSLLFALAAGGSFLFGCLIAILRDAMDETFSSPDDIENHLGLNCFGLLPLLNRKRLKGNLLHAKDKKSLFYLDSLQNICTFLQLSQTGPRKQIVTMTSALPEEGKSTTLLNMARLLGDKDRVLLIDADFRRPSVAHSLGLPNDSAGLSNVLAGHVHWKTCTHTMPGSHADVITNGNHNEFKLSNASSDILHKKVLQRLLEEIKQDYDYILIDAPPAVAMSDLVILAKHSDSLVFLVEAHKTPKKVLQRIMKTLRSNDIPVKGAILNKVEISKLEKEAAYYGYNAI